MESVETISLPRRFRSSKVPQFSVPLKRPQVPAIEPIVLRFDEYDLFSFDEFLAFIMTAKSMSLFATVLPWIDLGDNYRFKQFRSKIPVAIFDNIWIKLFPYSFPPIQSFFSANSLIRTTQSWNSPVTVQNVGGSFIKQKSDDVVFTNVLYFDGLFPKGRESRTFG